MTSVSFCFSIFFSEALVDEIAQQPNRSSFFSGKGKDLFQEGEEEEVLDARHFTSRWRWGAQEITIEANLSSENCTQGSIQLSDKNGWNGVSLPVLMGTLAWNIDGIIVSLKWNWKKKKYNWILLKKGDKEDIFVVNTCRKDAYIKTYQKDLTEDMIDLILNIAINIEWLNSMFLTALSVITLVNISLSHHAPCIPIMFSSSIFSKLNSLKYSKSIMNVLRIVVHRYVPSQRMKKSVTKLWKYVLCIY